MEYYNHLIPKIYFNNKEDAIRILDNLKRILDQNGFVTIADIYENCNMTPNCDDYKYGFTDLHECEILCSISYIGQYSFVFPPVEKLDVEHKESLKQDMVNHPNHYISANGIETWNVIEAWTEGLDGILATDTGNVIKYISRWNKKGKPIEDLEKCQKYLTHLIEKVKEKENK